MYKIRVTHAFEADINMITTNAIKRKKTDRLSKSIDELEKAIENLKKDPKMYPLCLDEGLKKLKFHRIAIDDILIIFMVENKRKTVHLLRLLHTLN